MATKASTPRKRAKAPAAAPVRHEEHERHEQHEVHEHSHTEEDVLRHDMATGHGLGSRVEGCTECCPECQTTTAAHDHHDWDHFPTDGELAEHGLTATAPSEQELLRLAASSRLADLADVSDLANRRAAPMAMLDGTVRSTTGGQRRSTGSTRCTARSARSASCRGTGSSCSRPSRCCARSSPP